MVNELRMAEVIGLFEDKTAKVQFLGEDTPSEKEYAYLSSYTPEIGDSVFLIPFADSYIIVGDILYMQTEEKNVYVTAKEMQSALSGYAPVNHSHSGYAAENHTHNVYALANHTHSYYSVTTHTHTNYAATKHTHDEYAAISHKHTDYATTGHIHTGYALTNHTHSGYAASSHAHDSLYYNSNAATTYRVFMASAGSFNGQGNGTVSLGYNGALWKQLFAKSTTISTSDRNQKKNIANLSEDKRFLLMFDELIPVTYQYKDNDSNRIHLGFIAQDVMEAMQKNKITSREFAGYIEMPVYKKDENGEDLAELDHMEYGLRYEEFIALNAAKIQELQKNTKEEIEELKCRLAELEAKPC